MTTATVVVGRLCVLGVQLLLEDDAELFPQGLQLLQVLLVLALVLDLGLDACDGVDWSAHVSQIRRPWLGSRRSKREIYNCNVPSKTRTAVGKSFTRRAARRAATITEEAGTKS